MPKKGRRPWYRKGHRMWTMTERDGEGRQVFTPLGVRDPDDRAGAEAAWEQLQRERASGAHPCAPAPPVQVSGAGHLPGPTVATAAVAFLALAERKHRAGKLAPATLGNYRAALRDLSADLGDRPLAELTADELEAWADRPEWSASYQNARLGVVMGMLRHARCPLRVSRPPKESRGADSVISDDQFAAVLAALTPRRGRAGDLADLLRVLWETGARPQEVAALTAEQVDWQNACARLKHHKTRRKTGRDRVLHFTAAAMAVLERQRERYGTGFLFRTRGGTRPYTRHMIVVQLLAVSERTGIHVTAYGLGRHSFATRALVAGVPDTVVAALLGHTSTAQVHANYSHVAENARVLKAAAEKVSTRAAG